MGTYMSREPATQSEEGDFLKAIPTFIHAQAHVHLHTQVSSRRDRAELVCRWRTPPLPPGQVMATLV